MAQTWQAIGAIDSGKSSGTSLTVTTTAPIPRGATVIVRTVHDNSSAATINPSGGFSNITSNVVGAITGYTVRRSIGSGSAAGAGVNLAVATFVPVVDIPTGSTITVTLGVAVASRAVSISYIGGGLFSGVVSAIGTTGSPSITVTPTAVGQTLAVTVGVENNDSTTFSSVLGWTLGTKEGTRGGQAATNVAMQSVRQMQVTSLGSRLYNPTVTSGDWVAIGMIFDDASPRVDSLSPNVASVNTPTEVTITGGNFVYVSDVKMEDAEAGTSYSATSYTVNSDTSITATFNIPRISATHKVVVYASGAYSDGDAFTVLNPFSEPTNFNITSVTANAPGKLLISWGASAGIPTPTYKIERQASGSAWIVLASGLSQNSYEDNSRALVESPASSGLASTFGLTNKEQIAFSFNHPGGTIASVDIWLASVGSPPDGVRLVLFNGANMPIGLVLESPTIVSSSSLNSTHQKFTFVFNHTAPAQKFWLAVRRNGSISQSTYYSLLRSSTNVESDAAIETGGTVEG